MKTIKLRCITSAVFFLLISWGTIGLADNPIIQTIFTADPAPLLHDGVLYLDTGHDEDNAPNNRYLMHDYRCYTTMDMVNQTTYARHSWDDLAPQSSSTMMAELFSIGATMPVITPNLTRI
jgi:hypothetical protein